MENDQREKIKTGFGKEELIINNDGIFENKYTIIKQLGAGGYGRCLLVKSKTTGSTYACKELQIDKLTDIDKLLNEINIMKKLDHPNIIKIYETFRTNSLLYIIMECCEGGELFDKITEKIKKGKLFTEKEAANLFKQYMTAVNYCHKSNIVHRDLKPENLLFLTKDENSPLKLIDFGLSKFYNKTYRMTKSIGTVYYISPEVLNESYTEKCDIWSCGIILYILLCGYPPFNGDTDNEIIKRIESGKLYFPKEEWEGISEDCKDLITKMLKFEYERPSAEEVLNHKWVKENAPNATNEGLKFNKQNFLNFSKLNILQKACITYTSLKTQQKEIPNLVEAFKRIDTNLDGKLSYNEMKEAISNSKILNFDGFEEIFKSLDTDKTGLVNYTEFISASIDKSLYLQEEKLKDAFNFFDIDKNGTVSKKEIISRFKNFIDKKECEEIFKKFDLNKDGEFNFEEFLKMMKQ